MLNALLVSDICIDLTEKCKLGTVQCRDMKACLSHKGKKSHGFQRDSFTTGVWSCDNQEVKIISKADVNRNGFLLIDQRMTGLAQANPSFSIEDRFAGIHVHGKSGAGKNKVQLYHDGKICMDGFQFCSYLLA